MSLPDLTQLRILLIQDDENDRFAFRRALGNGNVACEIVECERGNGASRLICAETSRFDLAVIDEGLSGISGKELCKVLLNSGISLPLVILTGRGSMSRAVAAIKAGATDYIFKDAQEKYLDLLPVVLPEVVRQHKDRLRLELAEEASLENNFRLFQILQRISIPTFVIDRGHVITHWNRAMENLTGISASEMIGTREQWRAFYPAERPVLSDLVVDAAPEDVMTGFYDGKHLKTSLVDGAYEAEDYFPAFGATGKWLYFTAAPLPDRSGRITGAIETLQDITERKQVEAELRESERRYREMSITDSLTKIFNSRHFFSQLKYEVERANRYRHPLSLILLDIDNFKNYNDTYGHQEGDKVLVVLAEVISAKLRQTDTAYRYGGEEFTLLLPETESEDGLHIADRIRKDFEERALYPLPGTEVHATVSIGVSRYKPGEESSAFLKRVDEGMYRAKEMGKNRVFHAL